MAGRGRGRGAPGSTMSFTVDQLNALGLSGPALRAELNQTILGPPPHFPPLLNKAPPITIRPQEEYILLLKKELTEYFKESVISTKTINKSADQLFGSQCPEILSKPQECRFIWEHLPMELRPGGLKRKPVKTETKKTKSIDINSRLSVLEQREMQGGKRTKLDDSELDVTNKEENEGNEDREEEQEEEQPDEEMDTGTDYVCDYFDNGEAFEDEDDNLDEPCF